MVFHGHIKGLAVGERLIDADLVTPRQKMMLDIADDDFAGTSVIVIETDADVNIRRIAAQQSRLARETMTINQECSARTCALSLYVKTSQKVNNQI